MQQGKPAAVPDGAPGPDPRPREVDSRTLFGGGRELRILHHGATYTLRQTRQGKLILTK